MDLLQLHVQETLVCVSVVPFIRPMKLNIGKELSHGDRRGRNRGFTARCRIKTLTQGFLFLLPGNSEGFCHGFPSAGSPLPVPVSGLCIPPVFPVLFPDGLYYFLSQPSELLIQVQVGWEPARGGASAQGAGPRGRQHDVTARLGL